MSIEVAKKAFHEACDILGITYASHAAEVLILAFGGQETKYLARRQLISQGGKLVPKGPAASFWQLEQGNAKSRAGVTGVIMHKASKELARRLCNVRGVPFEARAIWEALEHDDVLGAGFARLLLLTDAAKLPAVGDQDAAWECYLRVWRPGKPHPATWPTAYRNAVEAAAA